MLHCCLGVFFFFAQIPQMCRLANKSSPSPLSRAQSIYFTHRTELPESHQTPLISWEQWTTKISVRQWLEQTQNSASGSLNQQPASGLFLSFHFRQRHQTTATVASGVRMLLFFVLMLKGQTFPFNYMHDLLGRQNGKISLNRFFFYYLTWHRGVMKGQETSLHLPCFCAAFLFLIIVSLHF